LAQAKERNIADFIEVPRSGFIRCPFHGERTASCKIYGNTYHCFGCGEHGDVIDWIQKTENKTLPQAVKALI
jgi:DNA primase